MKFAFDRAELEHPAGIEIAVKGFKSNPTDGTESPAQVFIEVYEGRLRVHVWSGKEDPATSVVVDPL
jgi:hypothetical protein